MKGANYSKKQDVLVSCTLARTVLIKASLYTIINGSTILLLRSSANVNSRLFSKEWIPEYYIYITCL